MKKIIVISAVCMIAAASWARSVSEIYSEFSACNAQERESFLNAITTEEWRAIAEDEISSNRRCRPSAYLNLCRATRKNLPPASEYDERYSSCSNIVSCVITGANMFEAMPKCADAAIRRMETVRPACARAYRNHRSLVNVPTCERVNILVDQLANREQPCIVTFGFDAASRKLVGLIVKDVKRILRERGDTFIVGPDGKNKVQDAIDELSAALNAPRANGVKEWIAKWFPEYEWVDPKFISDADLKAYCDNIYFGQSDFNLRAKGILRLNLGLDGYNRFIEKYNK